MNTDDFLADAVLNRMDTKGESLEAAIEAVTGDSAESPLGKRIAALLGVKSEEEL